MQPPPNGDYSIPDIIRWNRTQDEAVKKLEDQMDGARPSVLSSQVETLNRRVGVLIAAALTLSASLIICAITIAFAVKH
jgi:hypothetical protein